MNIKTNSFLELTDGPEEVLRFKRGPGNFVEVLLKRGGENWVGPHWWMMIWSHTLHSG